MTSPNIMAIAEAAKKDAHRAADLRTAIAGLERGIEAYTVSLDIRLPTWIDDAYKVAAEVEKRIKDQWEVISGDTLTLCRHELATIEAKYEGVESKVTGQ